MRAERDCPRPRRGEACQNCFCKNKKGNIVSARESWLINHSNKVWDLLHSQICSRRSSVWVASIQRHDDICLSNTSRFVEFLDWGSVFSRAFIYPVLGLISYILGPSKQSWTISQWMNSTSAISMCLSTLILPT